jgi:hypothetical protein
MRSNCVMATSFWRLMLNCVCMYVCMYISNTRKFLAFDAQLCVCVCMHVRMYARMYVCVHVCPMALWQAAVSAPF